MFHLRSSQCSLNLSWWWKKTNSYDLCMLKHSCWISSTSACDNTWPVLSEIPTTASAAIRGGSIEAITAAATAVIGFGCAGFFRHWPPRRCSALITRPCQSKWKASSPSTPPLRSAPLQLFLFYGWKEGKRASIKGRDEELISEEIWDDWGVAFVFSARFGPCVCVCEIIKMSRATHTMLINVLFGD